MLNQPFADLNISSPEIPPLLKKTVAAPNAQPPKVNCNTLRKKIDALTAILGKDIASTNSGADTAILTRQSAGDAAWGAAQSAAAGWIPFRGAIRFVTDANRHDRRIVAAILAGIVRLAYLKGMRERLNSVSHIASTPLSFVANPGLPKSSVSPVMPGH